MEGWARPSKAWPWLCSWAGSVLVLGAAQPRASPTRAAAPTMALTGAWCRFLLPRWRGRRRVSPSVPAAVLPACMVPARPPAVCSGGCCFPSWRRVFKSQLFEDCEKDSYSREKKNKKKPHNTKKSCLTCFFFQISHFHPQSQHTNLVNVARRTIFPLVILYIQASRMDHKLALYGFNISIASHILCKWRYLPWQALLWSTVLL